MATMKPLRIAIINEIWTAGATRCAKDLEQHLTDRHVVRYYPREQRETVSSLLTDLAAFVPDIVHCHSYYGDLPYQVLATLSHRYSTCLTVHDPRPIGTMNPICWECPHNQTCFRCPLVKRFRKLLLLNPYFWQRLQKRFVHWRSASTLTFITPSQWLERRLAKTEIRRFSIQHITNAIDLDHFIPIPDARRQLNLLEDRRIIFYIAHPGGTGWTIDPRKGLAFLAEAFTRVVLPQNPETLLMIAGERLVPNHPNVMPLGFIQKEDLPKYYSAADVVVVPTLADSLTYTVREAMGCATPVVAFNVGGIPEGIDDGITGYLISPGDSNALGAAILRLVQNPEPCRQMGLAGRAKAVQLFDMNVFIQHHETLYEQMVAQFR